MSYLNIAAIVNKTSVEGPGKRTAIWVQGCLKRCRGCCNPGFLEIKPAQIMSVSELCHLIDENHGNYDIEGITILGGEPFLQASGLAEIAEHAQRQGLSVMIFTGYQFDEIKEEKFSGASKLIRNTDVLVDGVYDSKLQEKERNWVGSTNQQFHYISGRYDNRIEKINNMITNEWRISAGNIITGNGLPFILKNRK